MWHRNLYSIGIDFARDAEHNRARATPLRPQAPRRYVPEMAVEKS
jgi:hypothetical protein